MNALPVTDWQFVVVSAIALAALWVLLRRVAPRPATRKAAGAAGPAPACGHCASNPSASAPARTTTTPIVPIADLRREGTREKAEGRRQKEEGRTH